MKTLIDLFQNSYKYKGKTAFVYRTGIRRFVFSFDDFHQQSLKAAQWFSEQGVGKGDRVVIWTPNSPWWAFAFWGAVLNGAIVVPVDFASGRERAEKIAERSGARLVLQSQYKLDKIDQLKNSFIEDLQFLVADVNAIARPSDIAETDIAELIYTSGTTGDPKGVILTHKNLITNLVQANERISVISEQWNFLSLLPLSHMFEQTCGFLTPLYRGAAVVYIRALKPSAIMAALAEENIFVMIAVPRLLQLLKSGIEREVRNNRLVKIFPFLTRLGVRSQFGKNFNFFVSGGSPLDIETGKFWQSLGLKLLEGYGLTECSPILTANFVGEQRLGSVGKPLEGVEIKLNESKEILVRGENVFGGYWQKPEATKAVFTADGWFKTGDLGEISPDGWLTVKGRVKDMIATGAGVKVYPEDVENILNKIPGVKESCVVGKKTNEGEEVHAVLILDNADYNPADVIREANSNLDNLQQITSFSLWPEPEFPKTTTLKIQKFVVRQSLQDKQGHNRGQSADKLINLVSKVTNKPAEDITELSALVADLGLSSIARLELVSYLEQEFRLDMDDSQIDQNTTVAALRAMVQKREKLSSGLRYSFWPNRPFGRFLRGICNWLINYPVFFGFATLKKAGLENIEQLNSPAVFIANHTSYFDHPAVVFSLPKKIRYRIAVAAWQEWFTFNVQNNPLKRLWKKLAYYYSKVGLNVFLLPRTIGFRRAMEFMGKLADNGVNILVFPEGARSADGNPLPFMDGLALMVKELHLPVVPVRLRGLEKVYRKGTALPKMGTVEVCFGQPIYFKQESSKEILEKSREAILNL